MTDKAYKVRIRTTDQELHEFTCKDKSRVRSEVEAGWVTYLSGARRIETDLNASHIISVKFIEQE